MRNRLLLTICVLASCLLSGCVKDLKKAGISETTMLVGRVLEESERTPLSDVQVMVTNGETVYFNATTSANGVFSLEVDFGRVDKNSYVYLKKVDDFAEITKRLELRGMGKETWDYDDIFLYNKTHDVVPTVNTSSVTDIHSNTAVGGGNVSSQGSSTVTDRGICWSQTQNPTIADRTADGGDGTGTFSCQMTDLSPNTKYYVRAYAVNRTGVGYGATKSFTTSAASDVPTVETHDLGSVTANSAVCNGKVTSDGGDPVTRRGFCYGRSSNPTTSNSTVDDNTGGTGTYSCTLTGLQPNTTYHVRAFAVNAKGTAYGADKSFKTSNAVVNDWLGYGSESDMSYWGLTNGGDDEWAVMFPSSTLSTYAGANITKVRVYINEVGSYTMNIYEGGTSSPSSLKRTLTYSISNTGWRNLLVNPGYGLNTSSNLWVSLSFSYSAGQYPRSACGGANNPNARWARANGGSWHDAMDHNGGEDLSWAIRVYVTNEEKGGGEFELSSDIAPSSTTLLPLSGNKPKAVRRELGIETKRK